MPTEQAEAEGAHMSEEELDAVHGEKDKKKEENDDDLD